MTCFTLAGFFLVSANIQIVNMALAILSDLVRTSTTGLLLMTHFRSETKSMSFSSGIFVKKSVNCYSKGNTYSVIFLKPLLFEFNAVLIQKDTTFIDGRVDECHF